MLKQIVLISIIFFVCNPVYVQPESGIEFNDAIVTFELPGENVWRITDNNIKEGESRGLVMLKRNVIRDDQGRKIIPAMGITFTKVPLNVNWNMFFTLTVAQMQIVPNIDKDKILNYEDGAFSMQPATALYAKTKNHGMDHTTIYSLFLKNGVGLIVICNATDGVFAKVEQEMLDFIKTIEIN